ncbi:hypothetical protein KFV81_24610 [Klebsiella pneumoniae]|nr:hypothetical protein [Klebsiella pneumoniae]
MASVSVCCPSCSATEGVMRNDKSRGLKPNRTKTYAKYIF